MIDPDYPIPISSLEHFEYCPRQCALILVDGVWSENRHTVRGKHFHRRADSGQSSTGRGVRTLRALDVWSDALGLIGRADAVEINRDDTMVPIEYKTGTRHGLTARVQLCAIALCLEEMTGARIPEGAVWYGKHRRRDLVALDKELRQHTVADIERVHNLRRQLKLPAAPNDERCQECQLIGACLPERSSADAGSDSASEYLASVVFADDPDLARGYA